MLVFLLSYFLDSKSKIILYDYAWADQVPGHAQQARCSQDIPEVLHVCCTGRLWMDTHVNPGFRPIGFGFDCRMPSSSFKATFLTWLLFLSTEIFLGSKKNTHGENQTYGNFNNHLWLQMLMVLNTWLLLP